MVVMALLLLGLWIALTDNTRPWELAAGAACAVVAGVLAGLVARRGDVRVRVRATWLRRGLAAPWWIVRDSAIVLSTVVRRGARGGRMVAVPFPAGGDEPLDRGRRAVALGLGSAGPNQYAVAESAEDDVLVVHELRPARTVTARDVVADP